jgi:hypothetical protein
VEIPGTFQRHTDRKYNGTAWTSTVVISYEYCKRYLAGFGTQTAGLALVDKYCHQVAKQNLIMVHLGQQSYFNEYCKI